MDIVSSILSVVLFYAFVPGVLVTLPNKSSGKATVLITHAVLFALVTSFVMRYYWTNIRGYIESFGNYGPTCPPGYVEGLNQGGQPDCILSPAGNMLLKSPMA